MAVSVPSSGLKRALAVWQWETSWFVDYCILVPVGSCLVLISLR